MTNGVDVVVAPIEGDGDGVGNTVTNTGGSSAIGSPSLSTDIVDLNPVSFLRTRIAAFLESIPEKQIRDRQDPVYTQPSGSAPHSSTHFDRGIQILALCPSFLKYLFDLGSLQKLHLVSRRTTSYCCLEKPLQTLRHWTSLKEESLSPIGYRKHNEILMRKNTPREAQ